MARAPLTLIRQTRSPERQQLADAILERDRRAALVEAKRAEKADLNEQYLPLWSRRYTLEDDLKLTRHRQVNETERLQALLNGENPPAVTPVEAMQAELAKVNAEVERLREQEAILDTDLLLLEGACRMSVETVKEAVGAVIVSESAPAAVVAEYHRLSEQVRMLDRAIREALDVRSWTGPSSMASHHVVRGSPALPSCPWQAARDRLASDPDARLPMPEDVFAEPPPRSAA